MIASRPAFPHIGRRLVAALCALLFLAGAARPMLALAYTNLGNIYIWQTYQTALPERQGAGAAIRMWERSEAIWPSNPETKAALVDALLVSGQYDRVGQLLPGLAPSASLIDRGLSGMRFLARAGRVEASRQALDRLALAFPNSGLPYLRFAEAAGGKLSRAETMSYYIRAAEAEPRSFLAAESYYAAADISMQGGDSDRTTAYLLQVLAIPESVTGPDRRLAALYWLGATYQDLGESQQAAPYLAEAVSTARRAIDPQGYGRRAADRLCPLAGTPCGRGGS